jgi:hypothetical protein
MIPKQHTAQFGQQLPNRALADSANPGRWVDDVFSLPKTKGCDGRRLFDHSV